MNSKTYISNPKLWEAFYKNMSEKKFNSYKFKPKQIGRGMRSYKSYVIQLRPHSQLETVYPIPQVTPMAVVEERAKIKHAKDVKECVPFVKVQRNIKRPRKKPSAILSKNLKTSTSQKRNKTYVFNRISTPKKKKPFTTKKKKKQMED